MENHPCPTNRAGTPKIAFDETARAKGRVFSEGSRFRGCDGLKPAPYLAFEGYLGVPMLDSLGMAAGIFLGHRHAKRRSRWEREKVGS